MVSQQSLFVNDVGQLFAMPLWEEAIGSHVHDVLCVCVFVFVDLKPSCLYRKADRVTVIARQRADDMVTTINSYRQGHAAFNDPRTIIQTRSDSFLFFAYQ